MNLRDLFIPFVQVSRVFPRRKTRRQHVERIRFLITFNNNKKDIECIFDFGYDHFILKVEWAKEDFIPSPILVVL